MTEATSRRLGSRKRSTGPPSKIFSEKFVRAIADGGLPDAPITAMIAQVGRRYRGDALIVGRAPNGWGDCYHPSDLRHPERQAAFLRAATHISFCCTWIGLKDRGLADFDPAIYWSQGRSSKANHRTTEGEWAIAQLTASWPSVVAELGCPILRLFGFQDCSPAFVQGMAQQFIKLPPGLG